MEKNRGIHLSGQDIGRRRFLTSVIMSSVAVGGFSTRAEKAVAQQNPDDDWSTFQFDTSNTGHNPTTTGPKSAVGEKWVQELPGAVDASSALVDGVLYVGSGAFGDHGSFQALNITNG